MGERRAARNCWARGSGGNMCSVCPASACIGAKVQALWRVDAPLLEKPAHLSLETSAGGRKEERSGAESEEGRIEKTGEERREKVLVRKRGRKAREKGRKQRRRGREGQVIPFTPSALQTSPAMRWEETQEGEGDAAIWIFLRIFRPHKVPHLAKTTPGQSVEERLAKLLAAPRLAASPLRTRAHGMLLHFGQVVCRQQQPHMQGLPRSSHGGALHPGHCTAPGCSAPPCAAAPLQDAALRRAMQSPACAWKWAGCSILPECVVSQQHCLLHQPKMLLLLHQPKMLLLPR